MDQHTTVAEVKEVAQSAMQTKLADIRAEIEGALKDVKCIPGEIQDHFNGWPYGMSNARISVKLTVDKLEAALQFLSKLESGAE